MVESYVAPSSTHWHLALASWGTHTVTVPEHCSPDGSVASKEILYTRPFPLPCRSARMEATLVPIPLPSCKVLPSPSRMFIYSASFYSFSLMSHTYLPFKIRLFIQPPLACLQWSILSQQIQFMEHQGKATSMPLSILSINTVGSARYSSCTGNVTAQSRWVYVWFFLARSMENWKETVEKPHVK